MKLDPTKMKDWEIAEAAEATLRPAADLAAEPKLISIESVMPSSHLILCRPLLLLPPIPPRPTPEEPAAPAGAVPTPEQSVTPADIVPTPEEPAAPAGAVPTPEEPASHLFAMK